MNILESVKVRIITSPDHVGKELLGFLMKDFNGPMEAERFIAAVYVFGTRSKTETEVSVVELFYAAVHITAALAGDIKPESVAGRLITSCRTLVYLSVIKSADLEKGTLTFIRDPDLETPALVAFREKFHKVFDEAEVRAKAASLPAFPPDLTKEFLLSLFPVPSSPTVPACPPRG